MPKLIFTVREDEDAWPEHYHDTAPQAREAFRNQVENGAEPTITTHFAAELAGRQGKRLNELEGEVSLLRAQLGSSERMREHQAATIKELQDQLARATGPEHIKHSLMRVYERMEGNQEVNADETDASGAL